MTGDDRRRHAKASKIKALQFAPHPEGGHHGRYDNHGQENQGHLARRSGVSRHCQAAHQPDTQLWDGLARSPAGVAMWLSEPPSCRCSDCGRYGATTDPCQTCDMAQAGVPIQADDDLDSPELSALARQFLSYSERKSGAEPMFICAKETGGRA